MILVDSLLYKIDQKLNKLSSNEHQEIPLEDKILVLNESQIKLVKQKVTGDNTVSGIGLDGFKKRYEDLEKFMESYENHEFDLIETNKELNKWTASIADVTPKYMFYIDSYILADKGKCKNRRIRINQDLTKHTDIQVILDNVHYKPSFEYQETINTISSNDISIFTDGTFTPTKLYLSYLRYPLYIDKVGYIKFDGTESQNQDCELKNYLEDELVDLTVQILAMYTENNSAIQTAQLRIKTNE